MSSIKVSVIVPVYNNEKTIDQCLESIVNQTLKDIEIICIDDGSSDGSAKKLDEWENRDERIRVRHMENHGTGYAINTGMLMANGRYIAEVDADDFIDPDMYEYLYGISDGADIVKGGYYSYFSDEEDYPYSLFTEQVEFKPVELDYRSRYLVFGFQCSFWSAIYRTEFMMHNALFWNETEGASFQDTSIIFKATALAERMIWTERSFYHWRVGEEHSITSTKWPMAVLHEFKEMEDFLDKHVNLQLPLRDILSRRRFGTYAWNLHRIAEEDKVEFAKRAAADFRRDNDYQDFRLWDENMIKAYSVWMEAPELIAERWRENDGKNTDS